MERIGIRCKDGANTMLDAVGLAHYQYLGEQSGEPGPEGQRRQGMFELSEYLTLAGQMRRSLAGKRVREGRLGNSPHKFVWYNRTHQEFASLTAGRRMGEAYARGRWLFIPLEPGYLLVFGECGGKILLHQEEKTIPAKYHLLLRFEDGTALSAFTQMWGAMELYEKGEERKRKYICDMRPTPVDEEFSFDYFAGLIAETTRRERLSVKALLTQNQLVPGLGNAIAQDIMFRARLNPKQPLAALSRSQRRALYQAIRATIAEATRKGGRNDEWDLYGRPGSYVRTMDKDAVGRPCPRCGTEIVKMQYLGGACYYCPSCQAQEGQS
jgi:formamidopyrimidine-DNA glycosylase